MIAFIDEHRGDPVEGSPGRVLGVEPICAVLSEHGVKIAPSTYYEARNRPPSKRSLRDAEIVELIAAARREPFLDRSVHARCGCICAGRAMTWPCAHCRSDLHERRIGSSKVCSGWASQAAF